MNPSQSDNHNRHAAMESPEQNEPKSFFGILFHSFFIIPFLITVFCLILFAAVHLLTVEPMTAQDYLENVKTGGLTKRWQSAFQLFRMMEESKTWQSAFELSKRLSNPDHVPDDPHFINELIGAFEQSKTDDNRVREYLALAMGRAGNPKYFEPLAKNIAEENEEVLPFIIQALGMLRDERAVPVLKNFLDDPQPRIRSLTVAALGTIGADSIKPLMKQALADPEPNVQWGAAISLALLGDNAGKPVLKELLQRDFISQYPDVDPKETNDLLFAAIQASSHLNEPELRDGIEQLAKNDMNMKIRDAASDALHAEKVSQ